MNSQSDIPPLGAMLRARRREKRLSLRDLSAEIGVSLNTLSRVERGYLPDLRNFQRIVDWLEMSAESVLNEDSDSTPTPEIIARHLRADRRLSPSAVEKIMELVDEMYFNLASERRSLAVHLRSAKSFKPSAGAILTEILHEMQSKLDT